MPTLPFPVAAPFGAANTGLGASVIVTLIDAAGTAHVVTPAVAEESDAAGGADTGTYVGFAQIDTSWPLPARLKTTITGKAGLVTVQVVTASALGVPSGAALGQADIANLLAQMFSRPVDGTVDFAQFLRLALGKYDGNYARTAASAQQQVVEWLAQDGVTVTSTHTVAYDDQGPVSRTATLS